MTNIEGEYQGQKTKVVRREYTCPPWWKFWEKCKFGFGREEIYYEKVIDVKGNDIFRRDLVKIISNKCGQFGIDKIGQICKVVGIIEGDLMLVFDDNLPSFYCWPQQVEKVNFNS